jgi:GT2 family glycosyltransferase
VVYILIPAHNNKNEVLGVLSCLHRQTYKNTKIVLIDDGSDDSTEAEVGKLYPKVVILRGDGNLWWTGANVMGVDYILNEAKTSDFVLLLNNDLVMEDDYVETLISAGDLYQEAIVGSALVDYDNHDFMESGVRLNHSLQLNVNRDRPVILNTDFDFDVDVLPGRGTLVPVGVFQKIGNFNVKMLPHYGADYEFSLRAKRAGYRLMVSHKAKVYAKLNITGIEGSNKRIISLKECATLLFSNKSKTNLRYYLNFVWLCSDKKHRLANVFNCACAIVSQTVLKTIPFYPVSLIFHILSIAYLTVLHTFKFLYKSYPVRSLDIKKYGLEPALLIQREILEEIPFKGVPYYYFPAYFDTSKLPEGQFDKLIHLRRRSFNYLHKINIVAEKINLLISHEATR